MMKPPTPVDERQRLETLRSLKLLDTEPEDRFDRVTRLAKGLFGTPIVLVSLVDSGRQWFKSRQGLEATETPRDISFCAHAILEDRILVVNDARNDKRFCDNPLVTSDPFIRFYAGYPLSAPDGTKAGTLCIIDREPREFSEDDAETLKSLGEMVEAELFSVTLATTDELTGYVVLFDRQERFRRAGIVEGASTEKLTLLKPVSAMLLSSSSVIGEATMSTGRP